MNFLLERVTQPEFEPITLDEIKLHLRISGSTADDARLSGLIVAAREWVEDETGRALVDQIWRLSLFDYAPFANVDSDTVTGIYTGTTMPTQDGILLRKSPVLGIVSVNSVDAGGAETELDAADYFIREPDSKWPRIAGVNGFPGNNMKVEYRAGFADTTGSPQDTAAAVPERFKQAMKLWIEANYDRDEKMMMQLLDVAKLLVQPERADIQMA